MAVNSRRFSHDIRLAEPTIPLCRHDRGMAENLLQRGNDPLSSSHRHANV
jgi:hypothetical protein